MIIANVSIPLLGMVDTAVLGHLGSANMLAGSAVAGAILSQLYWLCGFLRMSSTGLSAQREPAYFLVQSTLLALLLSLVLWWCHSPILALGLMFADVTSEVAEVADTYLSVRIGGAPAALINLVLMGWLIGQQRTTSVLLIQVAGNFLNIGLDILFVYGLGMSVEGVAYASLVAEYGMLLMGLLALRAAIMEGFKTLLQAQTASWRALIGGHRHMLIRNLLLQACLAFLTLQGARYGTTAAAINAILMQFFVLIALGLDGIANGAEALVGEAFGAKQAHRVKARVARAVFWSAVIALCYACIFAVAGSAIISLLTNLPNVQQGAESYLSLMIALPIIAHWCFLFDGIAVGVSATKAMRDTMAISVLGVFFPLWWLLQSYGNKALWYALLALLLARGITLMVALYGYLARWQRQLLALPAKKQTAE